MIQKKRNYKATFILDNRGKEDSVETIIEGVKKEITALQGEVTAVENIGRREFIRKTDDKFPAGVYVQVNFTAPGPSDKRKAWRGSTVGLATVAVAKYSSKRMFWVVAKMSEWIRPNEPRNTNLGRKFQATPMRGAKLFQSPEASEPEG